MKTKYLSTNLTQLQLVISEALSQYALTCETSPLNFRSSSKAHILPGPAKVSRHYPRQAHFTRFNPNM